MDKHDTLLLACNSQEKRKLLGEILQDSYNLLEADNSQQMQLLLNQNLNCIAAIVADMQIWEDISKSMLRPNQGEKEEIPAILISMDDSADMLNRGFDMGAADVIPVNYDGNAMLRRIETIVQLHLHRQHLLTMVEEQRKILQHSNEMIVDALSSIIEYRSVESGQHILRIRKFTKILLEEVRHSCPEYGLDDKIISIVSSAAALHDVGKIAIPDSILMKPGKLSAEEWEVMKTHSVTGCHILQSLESVGDQEYLRYAYNICRYHHERWDGSGYPDGLAGEKIPICAQVVGLADAYDALTSKRVYKDAYPYETAVNMILKGECGAFSPKLLECFKNVVGQYKELAMAYADGLAPKKESFELVLPNPLAQENAESVNSLNIVQGKYLCLLHYINGFVLEISFDRGHYHLRYNPYPELAPIAEATSLKEIEQIVQERIVYPEDRQRMHELIHHGIEDYLNAGLRRQSFRFRFLNKTGQPEEYDLTLLRANVNQKKNRTLAVLCRKVSITGSNRVLPAPETEISWELTDSTFVCCNDRYLTLVRFGSETSGLAGYSQTELKERFNNELIQLVHPDDVPMLRASLEKQFQQGVVARVQYRIVAKDGSIRWILGKHRLALNSDGNEYIHALTMDNTDTHSAYDAINKKIDRYEIVLAQTENVLFDWDVKDDTISFSNTWEKIFGFMPIDENVREQLPHGGFFHPDDVALLEDRIANMENGSNYEMVEVRIATTRGRYLWCRFRATALRDEEGNLERICGIIINIDAEKQSSQALQERAERDSLTKLLNKYAGRKRAEEYFARHPQGVSCAMLMIDLDNFKQINDRYGHLFGDTVLTQVARILKKMFRGQDIIARVGGDEFMVLMRGVSDQQILKNRCQQMIATVSNTFRHLNQETPLSCTVGIAVSPDHGSSYYELFQHADQAMYQAKILGKSTYAFYNATDIPVYARHRRMSDIDSDQEPGLAENSLVQFAFQRLYTADNLDEAINEVIDLVGRKMNVSRVYIFENSDDDRFCSNTFEWCNDGILPEIHNLQNVSYQEDIAGYMDMYDENGIFYCPDIDTLPRNIYDILEPQGIKSLLHCAIRDKDRFRGYIGFDECVAHRMWTKEQIDVLTYLSEMLAVFLLKKRQQEKTARMAEDFRSVLDNQNAWIYIIDPETCELKYLNAKTRELAPDVETGMCCYRALMGLEERCPGCPSASIARTGNNSARMYNKVFDLHVQADATRITWDGAESCLLTCRKLESDTEEQKKV